jgi:hypothetical protein
VPHSLGYPQKRRTGLPERALIGNVLATSTAALDKPLGRAFEPVKRTAFESTVLVVIFAAVVFGLAIATVPRFSIKGGTLVVQEKRMMVSMPHLRLVEQSLKAFPSGFEAFYNDRFALRTQLVSALSLLKYSCFEITTKTENVLIGEHGWFYLMANGDAETLRHAPLMTDDELKGWAKMLDERRRFCESRHIKFLYVVAPSKCSIYREFVPPAYTTLNVQSRVDQLVEYLKAHSQVEVADLRPFLLKEKPQGELYFHTDTHWNRLGAYFGYRSVMAAIQKHFPEVKLLSLSDYQIRPNVPIQGDLSDMAGLNGLIADKFTEYDPKEGFRWKISKNPPGPTDLGDRTQCYVPFATENPTAPPIKAVFIRDSFWVMTQPFFSAGLRRAYFHWSPIYSFPVEAIVKEKPDIVVMEMIERNLARPIPPNPDGLASQVGEEKNASKH